MRHDIEDVRKRRAILTRYSNEIIVKQTPGHYIHGPKINIHVFKNGDVDLIGTYLDEELDRLQSENTAVLRHVTAETAQDKLLTQIVKNQIAKYRSADTVSDLLSLSTSSGEWPAVIVIHDFSETCLPILYLAMSRARVYCSVLLFPGRDNDSCNTLALDRFISGDIKHCANVIRHYGDSVMCPWSHVTYLPYHGELRSSQD